MHKLLERQLKAAFGSLEAVPKGIEGLLASVDATYAAGDEDRALLERAMDLTSQELLERNDALRAKQAESQVIFDSVPAMIIFKDPNNRILRINQAGAASMGSTAAELEGKDAYDLFPREVARRIHDDDLEVIRTGKPKLGIIECHPGADGRDTWVRTDKVPYRDGSGAIIGVVVLCVDLTTQRRAEAALKDSEHRFRLMVETATEGIWQLGTDHKVVFCNAVMAKLLGCAQEDILGHPLLDFVFPNDLDEARRQLEELQGGRTLRVDARFRRPDGRALWVQLSAAPQLGPDGKPAGYLGMMTDITDRRRQEDDLRDAYARLQEVDRNRMRFLNTAAHELGTPLTPVKLQLRIVRDRFASVMTDPQKRSLDILDRSVARLASLVRDLLDAARLQSQHMRLEMADVELAEAARKSIEAFADVAQAGDVHVELAARPVVVHADVFRIGQVLDNLLGNAVKFTPRGGRVRVEVGQEGDRAIVRVQDTGIGIAAAGQAALFTPFSQVHDQRDAFGGTGLGLYICKGIVDLLGGAIRVASPGLGHGATFTVELPLAQEALPLPAARTPGAAASA